MTKRCPHGVPIELGCSVCMAEKMVAEVQQPKSRMTVTKEQIDVWLKWAVNTPNNILAPVLGDAVAACEELLTKLNHESYCHDKAAQDRTKAERERDALQAKLDIAVKALETISEFKNGVLNGIKVVNIVDIAREALARIKPAEAGPHD